MKQALSITMQMAVDYANRVGGILKRFPGGYWRTSDQSPIHYSTPTVNALVARGVAEFTVWKENKNGKFPIEMKIIKTKGEENDSSSPPVGAKT